MMIGCDKKLSKSEKRAKKAARKRRSKSSNNHYQQQQQQRRHDDGDCDGDDFDDDVLIDIVNNSCPIEKAACCSFINNIDTNEFSMMSMSIDAATTASNMEFNRNRRRNRQHSPVRDLYTETSHTYNSIRFGSRNGKKRIVDIQKRRDVVEGVVGKDSMPISISNVGNIMLRNMGWVPGRGLGLREGIVNPIIATIRRPRSGLGT